ncbi:MAG: hypothetical protein OXT70_03590 [Chloroflexota bacterium]|nr:hypothetical protein [Chloroflexota bacterium]
MSILIAFDQDTEYFKLVTRRASWGCIQQLPDALERSLVLVYCADRRDFDHG